MATLDTADFETCRQQILALLGNRDPSLGLSSVEFGGEFAGAMAQMAQSTGESVGKAASDAVPSVDSTDAGLAAWAEAIGLDNGQGGYGVRGATAAQGATAYLTGYGGTAYLAGQIAQAPGGVRLVLRANVTIAGAAPATGQILGTWDVDSTDAGSLGTVGNLTTGTRCTLTPAPAGSDASFTLATGMSVLGLDAETGPQVLGRIQDKMQLPPNGGNATDYKGWAESAKDSAGNPVTSSTIIAYCYPNYYGVGCPMIVATLAGSGTARKPTSAVTTLIQDFINGSTSTEGERPAAHDATVLGPNMQDSRALVLKARCIPALAKYSFDWTRGTTTYAVNTWSTAGLAAWVTSAGGNAVLELTGLAPTSLKEAVDEGSEPRIFVHQVNLLGALVGPVIPEMASVVDYQDAAGKTSLALKVSNLNNWSPVFGNEVFAGGPIVSAVAANILAAIDARGPSRVTGLADPARLWQYVFGPTQISTAAETTLDTDGQTLMVDRLHSGGATIGIGPTGALSAQEVTAVDFTIDGPEILYAGRILVSD